jgi:hypothetical protein
MNRFTLLMLLSIALPAIAGNLQNKDVRAFVENADLCEHLAGEWDPDLPKSDRVRIKQQVKTYCPKARKQMYALEKKHAKDPEIQQLISEYDSVR